MSSGDHQFHWLGAFILSVFLSVAAFGMAAPAIDAAESDAIILRLHGSNTIGAKCAPALASAFLTSKLRAERVEMDPGDPNEVTVRGIFPEKTLGIEIHAHGSSTSFKDLRDGRCDIGMASRRIKPKEHAFLAYLGDMTSFACEYTLALDGIAVIVNSANPLDAFDVGTIGDIFSGKIRDWSQVGGPAGPITIHARDDKSGTYDTFKNLVLGKNPLTPAARRFESNTELSKAVSADTGAVGFTGLPYVLRSKAVSVTDGDTQPVPANPFTVASEDYPLTRRLYLYTPAFPDNLYTRFFIDFALSPEGQAIVRQVEFVDMEIKTWPMPIDRDRQTQNGDVFRRYRQAVENAERVSMNFRFQEGKTEIDNRSIRDVQRLAAFLKKPENRRKTVILVGFADSVGDYGVNYRIALERARKAARELALRRVENDIIAVSAGEEAPVASNMTENGRRKNRRVEIWIR